MAQRPANPVPASLQGRQRDQDTTAVIYGGMGMDEKTQQLIEALATKLGTTAEHLWGVLVRQAPISGTVDLALNVALVSAFVWWLRSVTGDRSCWDFEDDFWVLSATFIFSFLTLLCVLSSAEDIAAAFLNPEYWALQRLLTSFK